MQQAAGYPGARHRQASAQLQAAKLLADGRDANRARAKQLQARFEGMAAPRSRVEELLQLLPLMRNRSPTFPIR